MKRKIFNVAQLDIVRRKLRNAIDEDGKELAEALKALLDELENAEEEFTIDAMTEKILELVNKQKDVPEAVATEIANVIKNVEERVSKAVSNGAKSANLSRKVKNEICGAILSAKGKENVKSAVEGVLVKNGISGFTFADVVDYTIVENWGNLNPFFAQLHETKISKFFYNDDELKTASILAKQWDKSGEIEKVIQQIAVEGKTIETKYVYKRQQIAQEDLDEIAQAGEESNFLRWLNEELDRMIVNTIVLAILVGDTVNPVGQRVTTFETIANKSVSDAFTSVLNPEDANDVTIADLRRLADAVKNPFGKKKIMCMSTSMLSNIAEFKYAAGGDSIFHATEDVAKMVGVDEIFLTDLIDENDGLYATCLLPDGYWYKQKNAIDVAYATWEKNVQNFQKERNIGGKIHDLFSTAVLKSAGE